MYIFIDVLNFLATEITGFEIDLNFLEYLEEIFLRYLNFQGLVVHKCLSEKRTIIIFTFNTFL